MDNIQSLSIIGLGFVGGAMLKSFKLKNINAYGYDKYKDGGIGIFEECLKSEIIFLALPTPYNNEKKEYDKAAIHQTLMMLEEHSYKGLIVLKSTVEPETTNTLAEKFKTLYLCHNPEFLTARTAFEDFHNQKHIVLGYHSRSPKELNKILYNFYTNTYPSAEISEYDCLESESMKIFVNCFYSVKVQFFNELYLTCQANGSSYEKIKNMMLKNGWINPMHTDVPGPDGQLSYGGHCFPKDTNALNKYMEKLNVPHKVLNATISERNEMRDDHDNCIIAEKVVDKNDPDLDKEFEE